MTDELPPIIDTTQADACSHFLRLADAGRNPAASTSEKSCHKIALAIIDGAPGLDDSALAGLQAFALFAARYPTTARGMVRPR